MKQIRAEKLVSRDIIKEFKQIDKLEESIQYDLLRAITKEVLDHKLIQVKKSNEREDPYGPTRYQIEMFVMSPTEFTEIVELLHILLTLPSSYAIHSRILRIEKIILDKK